jgi:hypothetical protein
MVRKFIVLVLGAVLAGSLLAVSAPAQAHRPHGDVYSSESYDEPYEFTDDFSCDDGLTWDVKGHVKGHITIYNVRGSDGQAYLADDRFRFREVWTNPANGRKAYVSGNAHFREIKATHVEGDIWRFLSVTSGKPFVVKNDKGRTVLAEWGQLVLSQLFDTLGDGQPGAEPAGDPKVVKARGHWPTWKPGFDFCAMAHRVLD